ncbi:MAG: hypothetical protein ACKO0M_09070 [Cyanobium sp.]
MVPLSPPGRSAGIGRIALPRFAVAVPLLLAMAVLAAPLARAQLKPTLLQRLRAMIGIIRPISVGGSRAALPEPPKSLYFGFGAATGSMSAFQSPIPGASSRSADARATGEGLCLLSPWLDQGANGATNALLTPDSVAITPSGAPPIASVTPLAEVQIWRGVTLLWRGRASADRPLANPLAWPLPPLQPGESLLLKVRMQTSQDPTLLSVQLRRPLAAEQVSPAPGSDPALALESLLQQGRNAEAIELLFQSDLAGNADLGQLARRAMVSGCGGGGRWRSPGDRGDRHQQPGQ